MVIKEEILEKGLKKFRIIVEFDGENYVASGYLDGNLINKTNQPVSEYQSKTEYDSSVVDNLLFLIKDDIISHNY